MRAKPPHQQRVFMQQRHLWGLQNARPEDHTTTCTPHRHLELLPAGTAEGHL